MDYQPIIAVNLEPITTSVNTEAKNILKHVKAAILPKDYQRLLGDLTKELTTITAESVVASYFTWTVNVNETIYLSVEYLGDKLTKICNTFISVTPKDRLEEVTKAFDVLYTSYDINQLLDVCSKGNQALRSNIEGLEIDPHIEYDVVVSPLRIIFTEHQRQFRVRQQTIQFSLDELERIHSTMYAILTQDIEHRFMYPAQSSLHNIIDTFVLIGSEIDTLLSIPEDSTSQECRDEVTRDLTRRLINIKNKLTNRHPILKRL